MAFAATGDAEASRDVAQEAFVTAWRELGALRDPAKFKSWLCGIVRNTARSARRHRRRHAPEATARVDGEGGVELPAPSLHDELERRERMRVVAGALDRLPAAYREPLVLFYWNGQSVDQVAAALELSPQTVRQRLCRGRKQLEQRVRGMVEDALAGARPRREGVAVAIIAAIITAERDAAAAAAGAAAGSWFGAGAGGALIGAVALVAALVIGAGPRPVAPAAVAAAPGAAPSAPSERVAAAEPAALAGDVVERGPAAVEPVRRAPSAPPARSRTRPRGLVTPGPIEIGRAPEPAPIRLPAFDAVAARPAPVLARREIAPPALDLWRDLDEL